MSNSILLVDDDQNILTSVSILLENENYIVTCLTDGAKALQNLKNNKYDIGIFDIKMPRIDGLELLKQTRKYSQIPIIFLTSKDTELDETEAFLNGADDYITKPFSPNLLLSRIKAVLRRSNSENLDASQHHIIRGDLTLDTAQHTCCWKDQNVSLTVTEFLLLETLIKHIGHIKSREVLMDTIYSDDIYVDDRTIDSHIKRIRQKFRKSDKEFDKIKTLYGVGYKWEDTKI